MLLYRGSGESVSKVLDKILSDEVGSKANVITRDAFQLTGAQGQYLRVMGTEEQESRIRELVGSELMEVKGEELEKVVRALQEEDERALSGMGMIFGGE
ncbi:MAG: hypothetical protein NZ957_03285 [Thaumarchaeota archaeon]|nr:hypothetical protein [Candidatus Calditenuaceae archaeon]MDW8042157.1 hypothetical protein [Nitrososphaerota archaeon]